MIRTLDDLRPGDRASVRGLFPGADPDAVARLTAIGFTRGAHTRCVFAAPSGEPRAFQIRGATVALRREDARLVCAQERT